MKDVLIIGGGPVGLAASIYAAMAGLSVQVLEAKSGVIDKACGEGLMPGGVKSLLEMGVCIESHANLKGIRYVENGKQAVGEFTHGHGWGIRRLALHEGLTSRALELGVTITQHKAVDIQQATDRVVVDDYEARYLIAADGLKSPTRKKLSLENPGKHYARYGLRQHFNVKPWADGFVEIHLSPLGEAYVTPVSESQVGVAILFGDKLHEKLKGSDDSFYNAALDEFPELKKRLANPCSKIRGAGPFKTVLTQRVDGRILLVGDAAGYMDPLTGEGVRLGFATAKIAVEAINKGQPKSYDAQWKKITRRYWVSTSLVLEIRKNPILSKLVVPILTMFPRLFDFTLAQMEK